MSLTDKELQNHFTIAGSTKEEWIEALNDKFTQTPEAKNILLHPDITDKHLKAPIYFFTSVIFTILRGSNYDKAKQYEMSVGLKNIYYYSKEQFEKYRATLSPPDSFQALRHAYFKRENATKYNIERPDLPFPKEVSLKTQYLDYISYVTFEITGILAEAFQKHDVAIEAKQEYQRIIQEQQSKLSWAEKAEEQEAFIPKQISTTKTRERKNVSWQDIALVRGITTDTAAELISDGTYDNRRYTSGLARTEGGNLDEWQEKLNDEIEQNHDQKKAK